MPDDILRKIAFEIAAIKELVDPESEIWHRLTELERSIGRALPAAQGTFR